MVPLRIQAIRQYRYFQGLHGVPVGRNGLPAHLPAPVLPDFPVAVNWGRGGGFAAVEESAQHGSDFGAGPLARVPILYPHPSHLHLTDQPDGWAASTGTFDKRGAEAPGLSVAAAILPAVYKVGFLPSFCLLLEPETAGFRGLPPDLPAVVVPVGGLRGQASDLAGHGSSFRCGTYRPRAHTVDLAGRPHLTDQPDGWAAS
ncbi:hypothetical protein EBT31_18180 [bacterium]|nr:hypothetical protein [bacterium]